MADNFNLINFKRGTLADLQALNLEANRSKIEVGTFYLTIDEGSSAPESTRLFIGREVTSGSETIKKIVPVNQGIVKVDDKNALVNNTLQGNFQAGDFAYVQTGNIFAIYDGASWKQINSVGTDTYISDLVTSINVTDNVATISQVGSYNQDRADANFAGMKIAADDGLTLTKTAGASGQPDTLTIHGDEYTLAKGSASSNEVEVSLTSTQNNDSSFTIKGGDNVTLTTPTAGADAGKLVISAADPIEVTDLNIENKANDGNGFTFEILQSDESGNAITEDFDPQIVLGTHTNSPIHFVNGVATLNVYTKDELNTALQGLNAMRYRGTVGSGGSAGASVAALQNVKLGDTFKVVEEGLVLPAANSATSNAEILKVGDVIIASGGTESSQTDLDTGGILNGTILYTVIPAGDETDTHYKFTSATHGINLQPTPGDDTTGSFALVQGSQISLTDGGSETNGVANKTVTVAHATIARETDVTNDTPQEMAYNNMLEAAKLTVPVITDITLDNGHVKKWTITNYDVIDTNADLDSVKYTATASNNAATVTNTVGLKKNFTGASDTAQTKTGAFILSSENLTVTAPTVAAGANPEIKLNFVWGSF